MVRETGVEKADFVVNGVLAKRWSALVGDLKGGGSAGGSTGPSASDFLSLPPPHNILSALTNTCRPAEDMPASHMGLLSAIDYANLGNVTGLVQSKAVTDGIAEGKK